MSRRYTIILIDHGDQPEPNWPGCCPMIYHDIAADFTDERAKSLLRKSYLLCKLYVAMLLVYSCAEIAISALTSNILNIVAQLIASAIYLFLMPFGDFFGRHLSLYVGFKYNNESSFRYYFVGEAIVIIFCLIIGIGFLFSGSSGTPGVVRFFKAKLYIPGVLISIFLLLVLVQTILHIILTVQVYRNFRSRNFTLCPGRNATTAAITTTTTAGSRRRSMNIR